MIRNAVIIHMHQNDLHRATIIIRHYNMVGLAVGIVISTMDEKSCKDLHNARKFEKSSKIRSFTHLAITMMKLWKYNSHEFLDLS